MFTTRHLSFKRDRNPPMSTEENDAITRLLDPEANAAQQKAALKWLADYMEESYILNLPLSITMMQGLETFSKRNKVEVVLKERAKKLIKKYRR